MKYKIEVCLTDLNELLELAERMIFAECDSCAVSDRDKAKFEELNEKFSLAGANLQDVY